MVRPGLLLYGYGEFANKMGLKPVMALKTTVSTIKTYEAGTKISYGGIYVTDKRTRMGVLPYGYADGFLEAYLISINLCLRKDRWNFEGRFVWICVWWI